MIRILIILLSLMCGATSVGQCPSVSLLIFHSQAELDAFAVDFPECTQLLSDVLIEGDDITNLSALSSITDIGTISQPRELTIRNNPTLTSLSGLDNLETVTNVLDIRNNSVLNEMSALSNLIEVRQAFNIVNNPMLTSLGDLANLNIIFGGINISNNASLADIFGLGSITFSIGNLDIINNDTLTNVDGLDSIQNATNVVVRGNQNLQNIFGLNGLISVSNTLAIENNPSLQQIGFTELSEVSSFIVKGNGQLTSIDPISNLDTLSSLLLLDDNPLLNTIDSFDGLTEVNTLSFNNSPLISSLEFLSNISSCFSLNIHDLGMQNLSGIESMNGLNFVYLFTNAQLQDISALNSVTPLQELRISGNPMLNNLNGIGEIVSIQSALEIADNNSLESLLGIEGLVNNDINETLNIDIVNNTLLTDISALSNVDPNSVNNLNISENTNLSQCAIISVCNYLGDGGDSLIQNNALGCNNETEILEVCAINFNTIIGNILFDFNNNGCDSNDLDTSGVLVTVADGISTWSSNTAGNGSYIIFVPVEGQVTTSIIEGYLPPFFEYNPAFIQTTFTGFGNEAVADFCITATEIVNDLKVTLMPLDEVVPSTDSNYVLIYENVGSTFLSGEVTFTFDLARQAFVEASPTEGSVVDNVVSWSFADLPPFQSGEIQIRMNTLPPPANEIGDIIILEAFVEDEGDESPIDNLYILEQTVVGDIIPNDIVVAQGANIFEEEVGDYLNLIVRFQNLEDISVANLLIESTFSNNYDWNTFRPLGSSHEYRTEIVNGNELSFYFDNIDLPPMQTDEEASKGYVAFQVRTLESLEVGDVIESQANIFFDLNAPIETNVVTTTVLDSLGVEDVDSILAGVTLYPNPVSQQLFIVLKEGIELMEATLYTVGGEELITFNENYLNTTNLSSGVYFLNIITTQGRITRKIMVE